MGFLNPHARISRTKTAREREREKYAHIFIESYNTQGYNILFRRPIPSKVPSHIAPRISVHTDFNETLAKTKQRHPSLFLLRLRERELELEREQGQGQDQEHPPQLAAIEVEV